MANVEFINEAAQESVTESGTVAESPRELHPEFQGLDLGTTTSSVAGAAYGAAGSFATHVSDSYDPNTRLEDLQNSGQFPQTISIASEVETKSFKRREPGSRVEPQIRWLVRHHHLLTVQVRKLLSGFLAIVVSKALQSNLPVSKILVDADEDPEERTGQVVLRIYVQASPVQALAFWDSLDIEMNNWLDRLNLADRNTVIDDVGLRFYWS